VPVSLGSACAAARTPPGKAMIKMCGPFGSQDNVKRPQVVIMQGSPVASSAPPMRCPNPTFAAGR